MSEGRKFYDANEAISHHAMEYACDLTLLGVGNIWERLYSYGRIPLSSFWMHQFPREELLYDALISKENLAKRVLEAEWLERPASINNNRWRIYNNRSIRTTPLSMQYKLYINLHPDSLISEFNVILEHLTSYNVPAFKFARDVQNIVRPDKFVAYLYDFETMYLLGESLSKSLKSVNVQPLPFTAALDPLGVVSCGFDPPGKFREQFRATSWRGFITQIIVRSFAEGMRLMFEKASMIQYSLKKISTLGIDTKKWLPNKVI
ncbi:MAG TPA: hypothetical protein VN721_11970 [Flavipsychrobacter sp.]|nr:hypothetical protein [Flavipsychrobacter sp.]